jgi:hypothetical protein
MGAFCIATSRMWIAFFGYQCYGHIVPLNILGSFGWGLTNGIGCIIFKSSKIDVEGALSEQVQS